MIQVASFGGGVNSTAMLLGMCERGEKVDLILFADTGGEKPETYEHIDAFSAWLVRNGLPPITTVRTTSPKRGVLTLEGECLIRATLPSIAFGIKACSQRFKIEPQDKFVNNWQPAKDTWKGGEKILKLIGYDAGEPHRARKDFGDKKYDFRYPLVEWGWGREECETAIGRHELTLPPKSSCFFCPNMNEWEILELKEKHPELLARALEMERNAKPNLVQIKGLGRDLSWQQIVDYDRDQLKLIPRRDQSMPCGCYDGE